MNFQVRLNGTSHLAVDAQPVPPVPYALASWMQAGEELSVGGRLLE